MASQELVDAIRKHFEEGKKAAEIKREMLMSGWKERDINAVLNDASLFSAFAQIAPAQNKQDVLWKVKNVLFSPGNFFTATKKGMGIKEALKFDMAVSLVPAALFAAFGPFLLKTMAAVFNMAFLGENTDLLAKVNLPMGIIFYFASIAGSFIKSAVHHVFVYALGGRKGFAQTYKAVAYSLAPAKLLLWVPGINLAGIAWHIYLFIRGLSAFQYMGSGRAAAAVLMPLAIGVMAFLAFAIWLALSLTIIIHYPSPLYVQPALL